MRYTPKERQQAIDRAMSCGLSYADAVAVRRCALTLHRWYELECGDSNESCSWAIVRGKAAKREFYRDPVTQAPVWRTVSEFVHDEKGIPYLERHYHNENKAHHSRIPDRERGAIKRLDTIIAQYPALRYYLQPDPRGGTLYLIRPGDIPEGSKVEECYSRGVFIA